MTLCEALERYDVKMVSDQHRLIARSVYESKRYLGPLGMIEVALAIQEQLRIANGEFVETKEK